MKYWRHINRSNRTKDSKSKKQTNTGRSISGNLNDTIKENTYTNDVK
jgi:hypothetical protein